MHVLLYAQEDVIIQGKVTTADGKPAEGITVELFSKNKADTTNQLGEYKISGVKPGNYIVRVFYAGLQPVEKVITIYEGEIIVSDFTLPVSEEILNEAKKVKVAKEVNEAKEERAVKEVKEEKAPDEKKVKPVIKENGPGAKMPLNNLENPQVYTIIPKDLIKEQVITDFSNALSNTPGLYKIQVNRGINSGGASIYTIRGFRTEASAIDGVPGKTNGELDPANVERIEVLKGPSATLFGSPLTSYGGMINIVTKKPIDSLHGEISYTTGSFNLHRITADVYGPANKDKSVLFRLNAAYQNQQSFLDAGFRKSLLIAPAVEFRASERFRINLNAEFYSAEATNNAVIFLNNSRQLKARIPDSLKFDWKRSYTNNDLTMKTPTVNVRAVVNYQLSDNWTLQTIISNNIRKSNGYYQYQSMSKPTEDSLTRNVALYNTTNSALDIQQNINGYFTTGALRHRVLIGVDYLLVKENNNNSPAIVFDYINGQMSNDKNYPKISRYLVDQKLVASTASAIRNNTQASVYSAYVADVLNVTDNLLALLSVRVDRFSSKGTMNRITNTKVANSEYNQTAFSPKFGLVYQVIKSKVSLFTNYLNGFANVAPVTQPLPDYSGALKPQQAKQLEGGVKLSLVDNRLHITASYYNSKVENMNRTEVVVRDSVNHNVIVQDGTQTSKGFEAELVANLTNGLHITAGFGHNNSKLTKSAKSIEGRRPVSAGPANLANVWVSYALSKGKLKGLGLGLGMNYADENLTANSTTTGVFTLPSYTLLHATLFYDARWFGLGIKIDNITDEQYFIGQGVLSAQMPRSFMANVTIKL
ncbi:TonB-dependent receptor [Niastella caeni]|nr:TonB-dependent receptor [Niastella caeni]